MVLDHEEWSKRVGGKPAAICDVEVTPWSILFLFLFLSFSFSFSFVFLFLFPFKVKTDRSSEDIKVMNRD